MRMGLAPWHYRRIYGRYRCRIATFLPCYFFTIIPAHTSTGMANLLAFVDGVTAAGTGGVVVLGKRTVYEKYKTLV